jgi:uncharacterized protein with ParB-like and HNH nuclease domain
MTTEIEAKEVTVGKLYSPDFIFKIPIYQRPLSWERDNFDQLFEDIFDAMSNNEKQYFLGSIILQEHEHEKNKYYLVDGQQRISALAILMAVIRDFTSISDLKQSLTRYLYQPEDQYMMIPAEMRIIPWEDLKDMFKKYIYEPEGIQKFMNDFERKSIEYNDMQDPQYHLYEAIDAFTKKLREKLQEPGDLEKFVRFLLNRVYLVYIKTAAFASAFRLFNVLNTRGLTLTTSDLLKSENIGEIKDESMRLQYATVWREIENNLGREELENVIAVIRTIQIKEKAKLSIYEEYRREIFEKERFKKGTEFIDYMKEIADIYTDKILEGKIILGDTGKENEYKNIITLLRRFVPFSDWISPLIAFYRKFKADDHLLDFILRLEKKVTIEWVSGFSSTERTTSLNRVIKLIEMEKEPQKVVDELLFYKGEDRFKGRPPRMLDFSNKNQIESDLISRLSDSQFYSIYGGKMTKYILLRIDMKYWELENFPGYPGTITVEHILPQTPSEDSEWIEIFSEEERIEWTNKLGNLVLLSGRKNSKAHNYDFNKKKDAYFKEKSTPFRITQWLESKDKWNLEELKARHLKLLNDAKEIFLNY